MKGTDSLALLVCAILQAGAALPLDDLVIEIPGFGRPPTPHFSGFLDATDGCNTKVNGPFCKLHYWLALAANSALDDDEENSFDNFLERLVNDDKPLIIWLNGGPGSSSLFGFLLENGPLIVNATGGLMENPWSWTKAGHLLALEAPVGVGFSYCANQGEGKVCQNTDKFTATASRAAIVDLFRNKFPEWAVQRKHVFLTGESYAGVYIPTLAKELLDHPTSSELIPLVGLAVGDPCTDMTAQAESMDSLWYGHKYGLVDDQVFDVLWNKCNARFPNLMTKGGKLNQHQESMKILLSTEQSKDMRPNKLKEHARKLLQELKNDPGTSFNHEDDECQLAYYKYMMSTSSGFSHKWDLTFIDHYSLFAPMTEKQELDLQSYLSRTDVQKALHVEEAPIGKNWNRKDPKFNYTKEYDACNHQAPDHALSMIAFYQDIVPRLTTTWVFNGDTDPCVSYEGTRTAVKRIGFAELDGGGYRPWFYNQSSTTLDVIAAKAPRFGPNLLSQKMGIQLGGHVVSYRHGLAFVTIHGSGHMAPQFRPQGSLHMIRKLVQAKRGEESLMLSPFMPSNETLEALDWEEYIKVLQEWTERARAQPYVTIDEVPVVQLKVAPEEAQ